MTDSEKASTMIVCDVASPGVARGQAFVCGCAGHTPVPQKKMDVRDAQKEMDRFDAAVPTVERELLKLHQVVLREIGEQEAGILEVQVALLHDPSLREEIRTRCLVERINVEAAVDEAVAKLASSFVRIEDPYFRERAADLRDLGKRILDALGMSHLSSAPVFPDASIIVTTELLPSVMAQLDAQRIRGLVAETGGQTAHATILARTLGIPFLLNIPDATTRIRQGDELIVDGLAGRVFVNPSPEVAREYDQLEKDLRAHQTALESLIHVPAVTQDGVSIQLCANIGKTADSVAAARLNADGVGLYRTEFVFLVQDHLPSEEEQYQMYRRTADRLVSREIVIRVLDIGSDKVLSYFPLPHEANPSLGRRGTRLLLSHPQILRSQLRAILRLSATHPVSILFPMVGGMEDMRAAKAAVASAKESLSAEGQPFNPDIPVGAMIETPAAAIMINRLASEVDFFSIGTNDLVQYLLTTDRTSSDMFPYYEPLHPAVLEVLSLLASAAAAAGKSISICGEMAGNPAYTALLLGLGFRKLSVSPAEILEIKNTIRSIDVQHAEEWARHVLQLDTVEQIKKCLYETETTAY